MTYMENKYYVPQIEEFYEGFEFEYLSWGCWIKTKSFVGSFKEEGTDSFLSLKTELIDNCIRVKCLDKEDIKSLGWKQHAIMENNWFKDIPNGHNGTLYLYLQDTDKGIHITIDNDRESKIIFQGYIKNKSELKILMKQLRINE